MFRISSGLWCCAQSSSQFRQEHLRPFTALKFGLGSLSPSAAAATAETGVSEQPESSSDSLEEVNRILASLPRGPVYRLLSNARDAFRDGLYWQVKTLPARALVVNANSLAAPDPLRRVGLDADAAARTAFDNLRGAQKFIGRAEEAMKEK